MSTASNVRAEKFWPAVPEDIWDSIREEFESHLGHSLFPSPGAILL